MTATTAASAVGPLAAYRILARWQLARIGTLMLPIVIVVQALLAVGIVVGFGFLIPSIDPATMLFLSTGAPTVLLLTVGLVVVPQQVSVARGDGTLAYLRSLPLARPMLLLVDLTVWTLIALPGLVVALVVAWLRYDLAFSFDWPVLVTAALLMVVTATAVGYAIAVNLPRMLAVAVSQVLIFFVLLFSPITFPADQLPEWFQALHRVLPMQAAADALRSGLAADMFPVEHRNLLVLVAWCVVGVAVSVRALTRRA